VKPGENILNFVDAVIDSSRYYVVRIKDPKSTRTTLIGVGFRERDDAFDLKNCLNEYVKFINRMDLASQLAAASLTDAPIVHNGSVDEEQDADGAGGEYLVCSTDKVRPHAVCALLLLGSCWVCLRLASIFNFVTPQGVILYRS
jgi:hypothetical protein